MDIEAIRKAIIAQADAAGPEGWLAIPILDDVDPSGELRVPRGAFEHWCVWRAGGEHLAAPWKRVSPTGVKQGADDSYHTDWMLGAGLHPQDMRRGDNRASLITTAAEDARAEIEKRLLGADLSVLLAGPEVTGRAWHPGKPGEVPPEDLDGSLPVAILRDAGPDGLEAALAALDRGGAVVVERGGEMAHLVSVLREGGRGPIVRVAGARRLFPDGSLMQVAPMDGRAVLKDDGRSPEFFGGALPPPPPPELVEPDPVHTPKNRAIVLTPCGSDNPADRQNWFDISRSYTINGSHFAVYGVVTGAGEDCTPWSNRDPVRHLVVRVFGRKGPEDGRIRKLFYAGQRDWSLAEIRKAVHMAYNMFDPPRPRAEIEAERQAKEEARISKFRNSLLVLDDGALQARVYAKADEEISFEKEVLEGRWDLGDKWDIRDDYEEFFKIALPVLEGRGIPAPVRAIDLPELIEQTLQASKPNAR